MLLLITATTLPIINHGNAQLSLLYTFKHGLPVTVPLAELVHTKIFVGAALIFTLIAMACSFLVVGICLTKFLKDMLSQSKYNSSSVTLAATFVLPIVITLMVKNIFLVSINIAAGIGATIIFGLMPCIIAIRKYNFKVKIFSIVVFLLFAAVFFIELFQQLHIIHIKPV